MQTLFQDAKALSSLAIPIVLGMSASVLIALVDTLMLAPLGKLPLAAAGLNDRIGLNLVFRDLRVYLDDQRSYGRSPWRGGS